MNKTALPQIPILILLVTFAAVGAALVTPGLTEIIHYFGVPQSAAGLTVTIYLFGYALSPLLYGPLANRYGRKQAIYIGFSIAAVSALCCILFARNHWFIPFLLSRFLLALGGGAGLSITFTIIADAYEGIKAAKILSLITLVFSIMPSLSIAFGSFLMDISNWMLPIYFLFLYALFILILSTRLPPVTCKKSTRTLQWKILASSYWGLAKNKRLLCGGIVLGLATAFIYVFSVEGPFIAIDKMQMSLAQYGMFNALPPIGLVGGSLLASYLAGKLTSLKIALLGVFLSAAGIFCMLALLGLIPLNPWSLFLPLIPIYGGFSLIFTHMTAFIMAKAEDSALASSAMSFINLWINALVVLLATCIPLLYPIFLPLIYSGIVIVLGSLVAYLYKKFGYTPTD